MQSFLSGEAIVTEVRSLVQNSKGPLKIAVAYWGSDSVERLGLTRRSGAETKILCDARSGVCSPKALTEMIGLGALEVRSLNKLHAKVYCADDRVIVGSANASANGLGFESEGEIRGSHEAALVSRDADVISSVKVWFDQMYGRTDTEAVDEQLIDAIRPIWDAQRKSRPVGSAPSSLDVVEALDRYPELLRDRGINVTIYKNSARSDTAEEKISELQKFFSELSDRERHDPIPGLTFSSLDAYETKHVTPEDMKDGDPLYGYTWESWLIDVTDRKSKFWYVPKRSAVEEIEVGGKTKDDRKIGFVVPVYASKQLPLGNGLTHLTISQKSLEELRQRMRRLRDNRGQKTLDVDITELSGV